MAPVKGHYVPKFYLKGFTASGHENDRLYVLDKAQLKMWRSTPANSASERGMYALDEGVAEDRDAIEKAFSGLEEMFSGTLRQMIESQALPAERNGWDKFLNLVALLFARVPQVKNKLNEIASFMVKTTARDMYSGDEGWERFKRDVEAGGGNADQLDKDVFGKFIEEALYTVEMTQATYIQHMIEGVGVALPYLAERKWSVWTVAEKSPDLICSDFPVAVTWRDGQVRPIPPGIGVPNTILSMPLNRRTLVVGTYEGPAVPHIIDTNGVAGVNSATSMYAQQLYSGSADFVWVMRDGRVGNAADMLHTLGRPRKG